MNTEPINYDKLDVENNGANPELVKDAVDRASNVLQRAQLVNAAQYAHGINSTSANIRWQLRRIERLGGTTPSGLNILGESTIKLAGYLYALKEGI